MSVAAVKPSISQEVMIVGGYSILAFFLIKLTSTVNPDNDTSWFIYYLSFVINFPHFLVSYQLLYWDGRHRLFSNFRTIVASLISPALLLGLIAFGLLNANKVILGYVLNSMYFFVGWHYVKQIFGVISVCNSHDKIFFDKSERFVVKGFLYSIWALSWISINVQGLTYGLEGIKYEALKLPESSMMYAYGSLLGFTFLCLYYGYKKYLREGRVISMGGLTAALALVAWYVPVLYNPTYFLVVPFFHSLQYLYFVYLVKRNEVEQKIPQRNDSASRKNFLMSFQGYFLVAIIIGSLSMWFIPRWLDQSSLLRDSFGDANPFMFAFTVFINIHHYFIDHAIWRHDNPQMKKYLF